MRDEFDNEIQGQMEIEDLFRPPESLFAVSRIFARARKSMNLAEQKAFVYALSTLKFTEEAKDDYVMLDKKTLASIVGVHSDINHLSADLYKALKRLPNHSYIEIADRDLDFYDSGFIITRVTMYKNRVRVKFEKEYLQLFTGLSTDYITMWSADIFQMTSKRSVQFYEYLRQITDTREEVNTKGLGVKQIKEMFDIPKEGEGSYMRKDGHFDRPAFEKRIIEPLCEDLKNCKMIQLIVQPDGKLYEKVKVGNRVQGYRFYWTYSAHPAVATASEVKELQDRVDKNPVVLKVAKDILKGEKKPKKKAKEETSFTNFEQRSYDYADLERRLLQQQAEQK